MDIIDQLSSTHTPLSEIILRLVLASLLGGVIGIDREFRSRPAGLRTHMLTALAAAVFSIITWELFLEARKVHPSGSFDPIRVVEATTAGVAFLAAGTIIQMRGQVHGLTTGAAMWLAGAVGVAVGVGLYVIALLSSVLAVLILAALSMLPPFGSHSEDDEKPD